MADPFSLLGLDRDADERAIKRAYATRLRTARPDVDPAAFQSLNEAYQAALEAARRREAAPAGALARHAAERPAGPPEPAATLAGIPGVPAAQVVRDGPGAAEPRPAAEAAAPAPGAAASPPAEPSAGTPPPAQVVWEEAPPPAAPPAAPPAWLPWEPGHPAAPPPAAPPPPGRTPAFDFDAFFAALAGCAAAGDEEALAAWLQRQPALWSLATKARAGQDTIAALFRLAPPMPWRCLDAVLGFFDLDHVLAGQDAMRLSSLRRRLHVEWLLRQPDRRELDIALRAEHPPIGLGSARLFTLLSGPFRWRDVLWRALPPYRPREAARFVRLLDDNKVERLPDAFDRRRLAFWRRAGDRRRVSWPRAAVGAARCAAVLLLAALVDLLLASGGTVRPAATRLALSGAGAWAAYLGWLALAQWQGDAQRNDRPGPAAWWRLAFVPLLGLAAVLLRRAFSGGDAPGALPAPAFAAAAMAFAALALAIVRYRRRANSAPPRWFAGANLWRVILLVPAAKGVLLAGSLGLFHAEFPAAVALAVWTADLWRQRAFLRASLLPD